MSNLPADLPPDFMSAIASLGGRTRLDVEDLKLMVLLETAGEPLYERLAGLVEDPEAKRLLLANGREETAHAHRLKQAIEILTGQPFEIPGLDQNPYAEPPAISAVDVAVLQGVAAGERAGDADYQRLADGEPNAEIAGLLRQNGREETRHAERVEQVIALLQA